MGSRCLNWPGGHYHSSLWIPAPEQQLWETVTYLTRSKVEGDCPFARRLCCSRLAGLTLRGGLLSQGGRRSPGQTTFNHSPSWGSYQQSSVSCWQEAALRSKEQWSWSSNQKVFALERTVPGFRRMSGMGGTHRIARAQREPPTSRGRLMYPSCGCQKRGILQQHTWYGNRHWRQEYVVT